MAVHEALMKFVALALELVVLAEVAVPATYKIESSSKTRLDFAMLDKKIGSSLGWGVPWRVGVFFFFVENGELVLREWREGLNL